MTVLLQCSNRDHASSRLHMAEMPSIENLKTFCNCGGATRNAGTRPHLLQNDVFLKSFVRLHFRRICDDRGLWSKLGVDRNAPGNSATNLCFT